MVLANDKNAPRAASAEIEAQETKNKQKAYKTRHDCGQASARYQAPMLQQWLGEGHGKDDGGASRNREVDMRRYLATWDETWKKVGGK